MKIAVDGEAGVGKSTVARLLAERLGLQYINTGAMYRAVAWGVARGLSLDDIRLEVRGAGVWVNGREVTAELYTEPIDLLASQLAKRAAVRDKLIALQRQIADRTGVVMEGRDIGTVVLPQADLKLYLVASPAERARRRARQRGSDAQAVLPQLVERDERDQQGFGRHPAADAVVLNTDDLDAEAVVDEALGLLERAGRRG